MKNNRKILLILIIIVLILSFFVVPKVFKKETLNNNKNSDTNNMTPNNEPEEKKELFDAYYDDALKIMEDMTLEQKVSEIFLAKYSEGYKINNPSYLGGYVLFGSYFKNEDYTSITKKINELQSKAQIKYTLAVDEEGGTVTRLSSKPSFRDTKFLSPRELYTKGGMDLVLKTEQEKIDMLKKAHINLNLAPVADISTSKNDFIYNRSIGLSPEDTATYISKITELYYQNNLSSCLKHFPGYGNNADTHTGISVDKRSLEEFQTKDFLPFISGINSKTPYILVSHNTITSVDKDYPASLSKKVISILKDDLNYTGLIITDDVNMDALKEYQNIPSLAINAGVDVIITGDYNKHYEELLNAVKNGQISEERINTSVKKIIAWKLAYNIIEKE